MSLREATAQSTGEIDADDLDTMGPVDYLVVEFPHRKVPGEGLPLFVDLVDRGVIRVLDLAFVRKEDDGRVRRVALAELGPALAVFDGASSNVLDDADIAEVGAVINPDSAACVLVYENRWAAPLARAMRRSGGQVVASDRLQIQAILAALDALEAPERAS
jgi:Family of unknown function (DUF6325)